MLIKVFIILVMVVIVASLASGLYFLLHDQGKTNRTVKALTWRVGLSLGLFIILIICFALGIISPHPLGV